MELAETSPDIVSVHGPDGRMTSVSPASRAVLGYDPEELIGRSGDDFVHGEDLPIILAMRNRAREADDVSGTFRMVRRDGTRSGSRPSCTSSATPRAGSPRRTRSSATSTSASRPSAAWPRPRSASAPPSRRAPPAWRSSAPTAGCCASTARCARSPATSPPSSRAARCSRCCTPTTAPQHERGERAHALRADRDRARRAPLPARRRPRRLGVRLDHARARRRRRPAALPDPGAGRHRAPPLRGRAAPHGRPRRAHRPAQPPRLRARARAATSTTSPATARAAPRS